MFLGQNFREKISMNNFYFFQFDDFFQMRFKRFYENKNKIGKKKPKNIFQRKKMSGFFFKSTETHFDVATSKIGAKFF